MRGSFASTSGGKVSHVSSSTLTSSTSKTMSQLSPSVVGKKHLSNSFDWIKSVLSQDPEAKCVSVASFKHAALSDVWDDLVTIGLKVEVKNTDTDPSSPLMIGMTSGESYWIASVTKICGYFIQLRYEGFGNDDSKDFWVNIYTQNIHPVGWCASQGKALIPPKTVEKKFGDWKDFLVKRLTGSRTLPENFYEQLKDGLKSRFTINLRLEVVDKQRISAVRVAYVDKVIGGRLHIVYEGEEETGDTGFWCHQSSPLIHPVGWAQLVGHELRATPEYARESLYKVMNKNFDATDAEWTLFPPIKTLQNINQNIPNVNNNNHAKGQLKFEDGMKLEAIDPLNLSTICVATLMKVLRSNYLMIGIDGMMQTDGSDWFCYHASSPCIFPVGFCKINNIELTPPKDYQDPNGPVFDWHTYLNQTKSRAAPVSLFRKDIPKHGFQENMLIEAVDLMEPRLVCVATVTRVVGRLLRVHFNGWDDSYDQWCDCESPELFPVGWAQLVGYPLEPPKGHDNSSFSAQNSSGLDSSSKRKRKTYMGRGKKRRLLQKSPVNGSNHHDANQSFSGTNGGGHYNNNSDAESISGQSSSSGVSTVPKLLYHTPSLPHVNIKQESGVVTPVSTKFNNNNSHHLTQSSNLRMTSQHTPQSLRPIRPKEISLPQTPSSSSSSSGLPNSSVVVKPSPPEPVVTKKKRGNDMENWSVSDVCDFLRENEFAAYVSNFASKVSIDSFIL